MTKIQKLKEQLRIAKVNLEEICQANSTTQYYLTPDEYREIASKTLKKIEELETK